MGIECQISPIPFGGEVQANLDDLSQEEKVLYYLAGAFGNLVVVIFAFICIIECSSQSVASYAEWLVFLLFSAPHIMAIVGNLAPFSSRSDGAQILRILTANSCSE
jgi:hypothetical protein